MTSGVLLRSQDFSGTDFDAQPDSFECPECQAGKDHFQIFEPPSDDIAPVLDTSDEQRDLDPAGPRLMYTKQSSPILASLHWQWTKSRLDTQPDFQRYEVWSPQRERTHRVDPPGLASAAGLPRARG